MKAVAQHIQLNVSNPDFYRKLFAYFEGKVLMDEGGYLGMQVGEMSFWIFPVDEQHKDQPFSRHARGIHHLGFRVDSRSDVDAFFKEYLQANGIAVLYEKPKEYPEFGDNYYAVKCEDPDGIVIEVFHKNE